MIDRQTEALAGALEVEIIEEIQNDIKNHIRFTLEYRIEQARRLHKKRSHLIRFRQLAKAQELSEAA